MSSLTTKSWSHFRCRRTDALDRFAVLQVQWQQLAAQLRPLAKHYVAHPKVLLLKGLGPENVGWLST